MVAGAGAASVAFDELGQAVLGEQIVDGLAEERLEGGVAVGGEACWWLRKSAAIWRTAHA